MTLEERIEWEKHQLFMYKKYAEHNYLSEFESKLADAIEQQKQLIEWLEELKARREDRYVGKVGIEIKP